MLNQVTREERHSRSPRAGLVIQPPPAALTPITLPAPADEAERFRPPPSVPRVAILLGASETGLAAMRLLGGRGARCWGVDADLDLPAFRSRFCRRRIHVPTGLTAGELTGILHCAIHGTAERPVLVPTSDRFVKLLSDARDDLRDRFDLALPPRDVVDSLLDKQRFSALAASAGVRSPRTLPASDPDELFAAMREVGYPAVVKLRRPMDREHSSFPKAVVLRSAADARALAACAPRGSWGADLVVQELVPGGDDHHVSVALALDATSRPVATFVSRKRRQANRGAGVGTFVESCSDPAALAAARTLLERIRHTGVAEVELKRHAVTGELFVIEVNPRLWSQVALPASLGVDFALAYCHLAAGVEVAPIAQPAGSAAWQDLWSDLYWTFGRGGYYRRGDVALRDWLGQTLASAAHAYFAWDDPGPALFRLHEGLSRAAGKARSAR